jgi:hypothetical protein
MNVIYKNKNIEHFAGDCVLLVVAALVGGWVVV